MDPCTSTPRREFDLANGTGSSARLQRVSAGAIFVRHGRSSPSEDLPTADWPLDPNAAPDIAALARRVPRRRAIVSSDYRRAVDTGAFFGAVTTDERLREVDRPFGPGFGDAMRKYLSGDAVFGWEPQTMVIARIADTVAQFGDDAIYVGHGTAFTLYLTNRADGVDAYGFWSELQNPDAWLLAGKSLRRI